MSRTSTKAASGPAESRSSEDSTKRRRLSSSKHGAESESSSDENLSAPPCVVTFNTGVKIVEVAAGGRHTLVLSGNLYWAFTAVFSSHSTRLGKHADQRNIFSKASDFGQVWGWGYGGEGQLGLGSRIRTVSSPHPIPCVQSAFYSKDRTGIVMGSRTLEGTNDRAATCVKAIACGGRHSAVVTGQTLLYSTSLNQVPLIFFISLLFILK